MRTARVWVTLLAFLTGCMGPGEPDAADAPRLFENARLVVGDGTVIEAGSILVQGGRLVAAGARGTIATPNGTRTTDLSGRTLLPALIDVHTHLGYEGHTGWGSEFYSRENLIDHLERYAYYGFGAVFSAGSDPDELALELQQAQTAGAVGGARLLFAAGMAPPGQGPNARFLEHTSAVSARLGIPVVRGAADPEAGRRAVREVAERGVRFVKIWVDDRGGSQDKLPPDVYRAIIDEAREEGLAVFAHQQTVEDMRELTDAGARGFLHGRLGPGLDAELAERLGEAGAFVVPNLGLGELRDEDIAADPFLRESLSDEVITRLSGRAPGATPTPERDEELRAALARLTDAGVPVVLGTDAGALPDHFFGYAGHRELEIYVRLGMTPMQALVAGTGAAAEALGLSDQGTLAPGQRADFIVLEANPLDDIRNTRRIEEVFLGGERVDRERLAEGWTNAARAR